VDGATSALRLTKGVPIRSVAAIMTPTYLSASVGDEDPRLLY
jgi:hypothetical protein